MKCSTLFTKRFVVRLVLVAILGMAVGMLGGCGMRGFWAGFGFDEFGTENPNFIMIGKNGEVVSGSHKQGTQHPKYLRPRVIPGEINVPQDRQTRLNRRVDGLLDNPQPRR